MSGPRVGIDALALRTGGGRTWLARLVPAVVEAWPGARVEVLVRPEVAPDLDGSGATATALDAPPGPRRVLFERREVPRWVARAHLDVLLVGSDAGPDSSPCPMVQTSQNTLVYTARGLRGVLRRRAAKATARAAAATIFVSEALRAVAEPVLRPGRSYVVPHGVAPADGIDRPRPLATPYVLVVAAPSPHKDLRVALAAVLALRARGRPERLAIVGGGGDPRVVRDLVRRATSDPDALHLAGEIAPDALEGWYAHAEALLLPSREESSGMPVAEALARGVPVVASDDPALVETAGGAARHHRIGDVAGATELLGAVLSAPVARERRLESGRAFAAGRTWAEAARRTRAVLEASLGPGAAHAG